jgi:hypothetical protein
MKTFQEFIIEAGDYWDPDPEKDKKLPGKGPQMRSREDRGQDTSVQTKPDYSKRLKPGETYMQFAQKRAEWQLCLPKEETNPNLKTKHDLNNLKKM